MDVPGRPWNEIAEQYRSDGPGDAYAQATKPMHALVQAITAAWWSKSLYAHTSMYSLKIAQTDPFDIWGQQVLSVDPCDFGGRIFGIEFSFADWKTRCPADDAFAKLEHILRNRLKWIVDETPR